MSIFDITPVGAFMNALEVANEKDRQNTRRVQSIETSLTPVMHIRVGRMLWRVWAQINASNERLVSKASRALTSR